MIIILYIAALIAAIALFIIAIYISKTLKSTSETLNEVSKSIDKMTVEVQGLTVQAQKMLDKTNTLLEDVNGKVARVDPVFSAVGDIGVSLFKLSQSARDLATLATSKIQANQKNIVRAIKFRDSFFALKNKIKPNKSAKQAAKEAIKESNI